jgi:FkbM family methyltransferase
MSHFRPPAGLPEHLVRRGYATVRTRLGAVPYEVPAQGARFIVDPADYVDRFVALYGIWEEKQLEDLAQIAASRVVDTFLDIGANTGFYSTLFAIKGLARRIMAFEPDPGNYARLTANLAANGLAGRIEAIELALGDRPSEVTLYEGPRYNRGESSIAVPEQTPQEVTFKVRQVRLDDQYPIAGETLIIKMDVEGYEFHVLAGMERTLKDNACYLQIELYSDRFEELKALMARNGYRFLHTIDIDHYFTNVPDIG